MLKKNRSTSLKIIRVMFPKMVRSCPGLFVLSALVSIANSLCTGILIWLSQNLYDVIIGAVSGEAGKTGVVRAALLYGAVTVAGQILNGLSVYIMNVIFDIINRDITWELHRKSDRLKAIDFENEQIYNQFQKAVQGRDEAIFLLFICFTPFTCHLPLYLFLGSYFYTVDPKFIFAVALIFLPVCLGYYFKIKAKERLVDDTAAPAREMDYYKQCITSREYFKETRILGAVDFFRNLFSEVMGVVNSLEMKYKTRSLRIDLLCKLVTLTGYGVVLYMLFSDVVAGTVSVGAFAAVLNGIGLLFDEMKELVSGDIGENIGSMGAVKSLLEFLELPEEEEKIPGREAGIPSEIPAENVSGAAAIVLKNVTFRYPNSETDVLKDLNLEIRERETVALVGQNGSGKTTLGKILLGLYEPTSGTVELAERREAIPEETADRRKHSDDGKADKAGTRGVSAVFQDFRRYKMSLKENVMISDIEKPEDEEKAGALLESMGIGLPLDMNLAVEFGGTDLSGGQWQRIAIARGIYRNCGFIVLDEPTAAIDPIEESALYHKFAEITRGRTAVLVTHRIGAAKIADRILVMEEGRCTDAGTHEQLMERCAEYRRMYNAQAEWYR